MTDIELDRMDPRLLDAVASLNQIGRAINRLGLHDVFDDAPDAVQSALELIVESAIKVVPGASAVIYAYDGDHSRFDLRSRVSAGEKGTERPDDAPRPGGIGERAIRQRRRILSYEEPDLDIHPAKVAAGAKAMAGFPLIVAERVVGVLYVYLHQGRSFRQFELLMLDNFCNQAAMALYQARQLMEVRRDLGRKEDELERLRHAGMVISSRLGLQETLEVILQMALEVTGAHYGIFRLVDASGQNLVTHAVVGEQMDRPLVESLPIRETSVMGWVAEHREPVCIRDLHDEPWRRIYYPLDADLKMRSELAVPLIGASGRLEGVLNLESPIPGAFSEQDRHLLQSLATQAVIAIQEVRLLDALQEVAQMLLLASYEQVLEHLVELACDLLNAAASAVWTLDGARLVLQSASAGHERGETLPLYGSLTGEAILTKSPVTTGNIRTDPRFHRLDLAQSQEWDRALIVPLLSSNDREPIGAFSVYSTPADPGRFAESVWDEKVLTCLAHYAALAVHNRERRAALRTAQERHAVAETFALVGDVAANLLHHLNNKVGTIPVRVQGIEDKCREAVEVDPYLASNLTEIERSASDAMAAVRQNLAHLRPIKMAPVDLGRCVRAAIRTAGIPGEVDVRTAGLDDLPPVRASEQSLSLVFTNLIENAAEAMAGSGDIVIRGTYTGGCVTVSVSDSGPGIEREMQDRIFEFGVSRSGTGHPDKLGFGLWWVKTLMVRLGGAVSVESDGAHGAMFRLSLPKVGDVP